MLCSSCHKEIINLTDQICYYCGTRINISEEKCQEIYKKSEEAINKFRKYFDKYIESFHKDIEKLIEENIDHKVVLFNYSTNRILTYEYHQICFPNLEDILISELEKANKLIDLTEKKQSQ